MRPSQSQAAGRARGQALAYFRSFYVKDVQLVSFSFLVSRAVRKDDPMYAKHWDILVAQRFRERPGAAEKDLDDAVGKKIQSHVRNFLSRTEPGKKPKIQNRIRSERRRACQ